ncbi:MAG: NAD-dependent epimerase/dehydratase family protein [Gammaproteobacteria bacterium]|nr:NAD-dependent epimerase/dehydratase family protein [Gammaproteobacteria bacterium]
MLERVMVTGASGFIGDNLVAELLQRGVTVYGLARSPLRRSHPNLIAIQGDLLQPESYQQALQQCDTLFHCAGHISFSAADRAQAEAINIAGTKAVATAALEAEPLRFVHLSACAVLGFRQHADAPLLDESAAPLIARENGYAYSKWAAEQEILTLTEQGLNAVIANISTVYGAGDRQMNSGSIIRSLRQGMRLIPPGGSSYIGIKDLLAGLLALAQNGRRGERYILNSENLTYADLTRRIAVVVKAAPPSFVLPRVARRPAIAAAWSLERLQRLRGATGGVNLVTPQIIRESFGYKYFSAAKAQRELGWQPQQSLESAVAEAMAFYLKEGLLK